MLKRLSDDLLNSIKQPTEYAKRLRVSDTLVSNFFALVATRSICFYVTISESGKRKAVNLGRYPHIDTATARHKAIELITGNQYKPTFLEPYSNAPTATGETLSELLDRYITSKQLSDATKHSMDSVIKRGLGDYLSRDSSALTGELFESIYRDLLNDGKEPTARILARYTRAVYRWAQLSDPCERLTQKTGHSLYKVEAKDRRIEPHQMELFRRVMPTLTNEQQLSIMIALCTGLRKSELQSITLSSLDHATQSIKLARTKNGKPHSVPLPESLWRQLIEGSKNVASDSPILTIGDKLPKAFTRQIPLSWHDCRRTAASTLISLGESESVVKALLNHSDKANVTQTHYIRHDREQIRQAVDKLLNHFSY